MTHEERPIVQEERVYQYPATRRLANGETSAVLLTISPCRYYSGGKGLDLEIEDQQGRIVMHLRLPPSGVGELYDFIGRQTP